METETQTQTQGQTPTQETPQVKLVDIPINNENMALNVIISFVCLAQKEVYLVLKNLRKFGSVLKNSKNHKKEEI